MHKSAWIFASTAFVKHTIVPELENPGPSARLAQTAGGGHAGAQGKVVSWTVAPLFVSVTGAVFAGGEPRRVYIHRGGWVRAALLFLQVASSVVCLYQFFCLFFGNPSRGLYKSSKSL
ncbi:hypothetical protein K458DRAFT_417638 [Lentithecium fluviatile CBS 122367]|uniref:Uncharacterized protein n=1 Tax=Lentithecium fluviatile CBS 122367 TaxID=1168545 RepID=A0A6G1J3I5_9PLEO|nr:hypothetical protein K458DRAFT_417638 [Lentithecium fluviatile CBS 122367]